MRNVTFLCAGLLVIVALVGYFGYGLLGGTEQSPTSLIPLAFAIPMAIGAAIAKPGNTKGIIIGMHVAVVFALLGGLAGVGRLASSGFDLSGAAGKLIFAMSVICVFYTVLAVRSFIAARKARKA